RVGEERGRVHHAADLGGLGARLLQNPPRALDGAARRIVGRGAFLPDDGAAVARIVDDEVGEGPPAVDAEGQRRCGTHSALILPALTTFAQRSRSFRIAALKASPSCGMASSPRESSSGLVAGSAMASRKSLLSDAAISGGSAAGPTSPNQLLTSTVGMSL